MLMISETIMSIADEADMIVNGYAFTKDSKGYRILNLNRPDRAVVITRDGEVLETSMDDIELQIVIDCYIANRSCLEDDDA